MMVVDRLYLFVIYTQPSMWADLFFYRNSKVGWDSQSIISDQDKIFLSHFWIEMFMMQSTVLKRSTTLHPQADGQTERVYRCLEMYVRCFCNEQSRQWSRWIPWAQSWYNTTFHISINTTSLMSYGENKTTGNAVEQQLMAHDASLVALKEHLMLVQNRMKK